MESLVVVAVLACPVGMGLMMWFMAKGMKGGKDTGKPQSPASIEDLRREQARLAAELDRAEQGRRSDERRLAGTGS